MDDSSSSGSEDSLTTKRTWREYLKEEVTRDWTDLVLLVGCFATGLLDAAVFNVWSCFVSMQTGQYIHQDQDQDQERVQGGLKLTAQETQSTSG